MQHRPRRRSSCRFAAVLLVLLVAGCGDNPLGSVGERSNEWIGPLADGVTLLSDESPVRDIPNSEPTDGPVIVSEGDG